MVGDLSPSRPAELASCAVPAHSPACKGSRGVQRHRYKKTFEPGKKSSDSWQMPPQGLGGSFVWVAPRTHCKPPLASRTNPDRCPGGTWDTPRQRTLDFAATCLQQGLSTDALLLSSDTAGCPGGQPCGPPFMLFKSPKLAKLYFGSSMLQPSWSQPPLRLPRHAACIRAVLQRQEASQRQSWSPNSFHVRCRQEVLSEAMEGMHAPDVEKHGQMCSALLGGLARGKGSVPNCTAANELELGRQLQVRPIRSGPLISMLRSVQADSQPLHMFRPVPYATTRFSVACCGILPVGFPWRLDVLAGAAAA